MTPGAPRVSIVVLGAGPAGLGAALELARRGPFEVTVLERNPQVGGNAGSFELGGLNVDYGSHRLHPSCPPRILSDIQAMLGEDLLDRPRHGRIRLRGRWVHFPLKPLNLAAHLPPDFIAGVVRDAVLKPKGAGDSFADVLESGLGRTVCREFYFPYARKIWGMAPENLDAEQARRRVSASSLKKMIRKALGAAPGVKANGAGRFFYPRRGFGAISEAYCRAAREAGAKVLLGAAVTGVEIENGRAAAVRVKVDGAELRLESSQILSTIPLPALVRMARPQAPPEALSSAAALKYRSMILIYLVLETEQFTEFDAHYFPGAGVAITRLSEPKNYGLAQAPGRTVLCAELPCSPEDPVWRKSDRALGALALNALSEAQLPVRARVREVAVRRLPQAYPIYTRGYREHFARLDGWASQVAGLVTFGRQGLFAHDNTHHTLAMAYAAADCIAGNGDFDRWKWAERRKEFETHVVED